MMNPNSTRRTFKSPPRYRQPAFVEKDVAYNMYSSRFDSMEGTQSEAFDARPVETSIVSKFKQLLSMRPMEDNPYLDRSTNKTCNSEHCSKYNKSKKQKSEGRQAGGSILLAPGLRYNEKGVLETQPVLKFEDYWEQYKMPSKAKKQKSPKENSPKKRPVAQSPKKTTVVEEKIDSDYDCERIDKIEKDINDMHKELNNIASDVIPRKEMARYWALHRKIQCLTGMVNNFRQTYGLSKEQNSTFANLLKVRNGKNNQKTLVQTIDMRKPPLTTASVKNAVKTKPEVTANLPTKSTSPEPSKWLNTSAHKMSSRQNSPAPHVRARSATTSELIQSTSRYSTRTATGVSSLGPHHSLTTCSLVRAAVHKPVKLHASELNAEVIAAARKQSSGDVYWEGNAANKFSSPLSENSSHCFRSISNHEIPSAQSKKKSTDNAIAVIADTSSCKHCMNKKVSIIHHNLLDEIEKIIKFIHPSNIVLTICLQPDDLYHINVSTMETGESLGCIYASQTAIDVANEECTFDGFLTLYVADSRNSYEQNKKFLNHTFRAFGVGV